MNIRDDDSYIIEYTVLGGSMKVTAFDPKTLKESVIVCSPNANRDDMAKLAIRKLHHVQRSKDKK